uniref:Peptidase S1 domain-containing protein n=1 Tax=Pelusios castaneus TaxID=367368 RepID=A0A8C8RXE7_9SAUR
MAGPNPIAPLPRTVLMLLCFVLLLMVSSGTRERVRGRGCNCTVLFSPPLLTFIYYSSAKLLFIFDFSVLTVRLGLYNLRQPDESEQRRTVSKLIPHPNYNSRTRDSDIMLIKLTTPVQFNNNVYPIALARSTASPGTICLVSGWGTTTSPILPALLQCANLQIVSAGECQNAYPGSVTDNMLCAGVAEGGVDSCQGDSGGPLVCGGTLQGIVSWGQEQCAQPRKPGVYTKISNYVNWIQATIQGG